MFLLRCTNNMFCFFMEKIINLRFLLWLLLFLAALLPPQKPQEINSKNLSSVHVFSDVSYQPDLLGLTLRKQKKYKEKTSFI